ncbi:DUF4157 domain-containing protein [Plantactinospora sp. B24E8]|uniref:eCIS core domain-containing protein n=1 Tax=Plantactinospora sp. B24E8 TaxID=3153567 RepID=UPI00325CE0E6
MSGRPVRRLGRWRAGLVRWLRLPETSSASPGPIAPGLVGSLSIRPPWALLTRLRLWRRRSTGRTGAAVGGPLSGGTGPDRGAAPGPGQLLRTGRRYHPDRPRPLVSRPGSVVSDPVIRADLDLPVVPVYRSPAAPTLTSPSGGHTGPYGHRPDAAPGAAPTRSAGPGTAASRATGPGANILLLRRGAVPQAAGGGNATPPGPGHLVGSADPATRGRTADPGAAAPGPAAPGSAAGPGRPPAPGRSAGILAARPATLAARPPAGPEVRPPHSAGDLPVLGAGVAAPGTVPDPTGAVRLTAPPRPAFALAPPGATGPLAGAAPGGTETPRQRWEAAVAARPLESPRPLPSGLHALARAITGRTSPPRFTTGPATRHALAAAGALGATTGSVVHLAAVPSGPAAATVLAHELAHTRHPVRRPRFLLAGGGGLLDDDERQALAAGRDLHAAGPAGVADTIAAGIVDRLPVGGGLGAVRELVTQTTQAVIEAMPQFPTGAVPDSAPGPAGPVPAGSSASWGAPAAGGGPAPGSASTGSGWEQLDGAPAAGPPTVGAVPQAAGETGGVPTSGTPLDPDRVVAIVEERLLREIERRGGRWAGVF